MIDAPPQGIVSPASSITAWQIIAEATATAPQSRRNQLAPILPSTTSPKVHRKIMLPKRCRKST